MSCLEHMSLPIGEAAALISLSVVSSVQCCMVISGIGEPARTTFISQRPAFRTGRSTAQAVPMGSCIRKKRAEPSKTSCRVMPALRLFSRQDSRLIVDRSVERANRPIGGAVGHPPAGERDVAAVIGLDRQELHHL